MDQYPTHPVFDQILNAEHSVRSADAGVAFGPDHGSRARAVIEKAKAKVEMHRLIDALSADELKAYGEYRKIFAS